MEDNSQLAPIMAMAAFDKSISCYTWPQHHLLCPICPKKHPLSCKPFSQQPLQQGRMTRKQQAVRCAAAASKDTVKQPAAQDVSGWAQSMGIESSGLRVAEFAGDITVAKSDGLHQMPLCISISHPSGFAVQP